MWGCDFGSMSGSWWGGFLPGSIFSMLLWVLLMALMVYLAVRLFKQQDRKASAAYGDSIEILKERLARGEISKEQFAKMKQVIS